MKKTILFCLLVCWMAACSSEPPPAAPSETTAIGSIERLDPAFDALVSQGAQIEKLAGDFTFIEGPLWRPSTRPGCRTSSGRSPATTPYSSPSRASATRAGSSIS